MFLMFLAEEDEKDILFLYMRNTAVMRKLKMYGRHRNGDYIVYISDEVQERMMAELQLQNGNETFVFERLLNEINNAIPQEISMDQKVETLRNNRNIIRTVGIDEVELEEYGGEGTAGSHWEPRILLFITAMPRWKSRPILPFSW